MTQQATLVLVRAISASCAVASIRTSNADIAQWAIALRVLLLLASRSPSDCAQVIPSLHYCTQKLASFSDVASIGIPSRSSRVRARADNTQLPALRTGTASVQAYLAQGLDVAMIPSSIPSTLTTLQKFPWGAAFQVSANRILLDTPRDTTPTDTTSDSKTASKRKKTPPPQDFPGQMPETLILDLLLSGKVQLQVTSVTHTSFTPKTPASYGPKLATFGVNATAIGTSDTPAPSDAPCCQFFSTSESPESLDLLTKTLVHHIGPLPSSSANLPGWSAAVSKWLGAALQRKNASVLSSLTAKDLFSLPPSARAYTEKLLQTSSKTP